MIRLSLDQLPKIEVLAPTSWAVLKIMGDDALAECWAQSPVSLELPKK